MDKANIPMILPHEKNIEFISQLPNEVLSSIFSRLSIKEIVRTSVLSKRYRLVWRQVPSLSLNPMEMVSSSSQNEYPISYLPTLALRRFTDLLALHKGHLRKSEINHSHDDSSLAERFIDLLTKTKHLKELSLACNPRRRVGRGIQSKIVLALPSDTFHALDSLRISNYEIDNHMLFHECKTLRSLKLHDVVINCYNLNSILSHCLNLEGLSLHSCTNLLILKVHSEKLECLEIQGIYTHSLDIHCENLRVLVLDNLYCNNYAMKHKINIIAPMVEKVRIYPSHDLLLEGPNGIFANTSMFLSPVNDVKGVKLGLNYLGNVKEFRFCLALNDKSGSIAMSRVLRKCSCLQVLVVTLQLTTKAEDGDLPYPIETFWEHLEKCDGVENHLRSVHLKNFNAKELEIGLAKFIISRAKALEELVIHRARGSKYSRESRQFIKGLSSMPKLSPNAIIKFIS